MYAVIRHYKAAEPGTIAEVVDQVQQQFLPILCKVAGFVSYFTVNVGPHEVVTTSLFDSREGAVESTRRSSISGRRRTAGSSSVGLAPSETMKSLLRAAIQ